MKKCLSGSSLKLLAAAAMLIDHAAYGILLPLLGNTVLYTAMRLIGRIAFPIYVFLIAEGFTHTRSVPKYILRLLLFALISEIPFDLAFFRAPFGLSHQNVFFTLALSVCALRCIAETRLSPVLRAAAVAVIAAVSELLRFDYGAFGILLAAAMYVLRGDKRRQVILCGAMCFYQYTAPLAFIPISMYSGEKGSGIKYAFYLIYPLHLAVIGAIRLFFHF